MACPGADGVVGLEIAGAALQPIATQGRSYSCLLYTSDAADELDGVDLGGRRIIKKIFF